ncbi:MAG: helix-turn-helix domain-containing protein [Ruminococcus sp.]|nr:helix-turn-helix domain-containing protein [Ruminococcus sp.]
MTNSLSCYSAAEVAKATGLSLSMVRKLTRTGEIPHIRVGRRILYPITALNEWMFSIIISQAATETDDDLDG